MARDLTAHFQAEAERRAVQDASRQVQRLQSLGQLAGGVAHDFNNRLAVILNYADFVAEAAAGNQQAQADLGHIRAAAGRRPGAPPSSPTSCCCSPAGRRSPRRFSTSTPSSPRCTACWCEASARTSSCWCKPHPYLPAVHEPVSPTTTGEHLQPPHGHGETILLVEDEPAIRELATRILTRHGYTVLHAGNGPDALALASVHHPDLLLTDVVMPQMSGPQLHEHIRHRHPGLPVLYMTGYSDGLLAPHPTPEHGAHVIRKPFSEPDLLRHVSAALANTTPDRLHRPSNGR